MNYRHAYHAGNVADVFKHVVLIALLDALAGKPKPFCYVDTHAGAGRYDLDDAMARKTGEAAGGIDRLDGLRGRDPLLDRYLDLVAAEGARHYPGSPRLASRLMREGDVAQLCELHPDEADALRSLFRDDPRVHVHQRDGYAALKALLPPDPRRGLVLIDPPFEAQTTEFRHIQAALDTALKRWPNGVYAVWYPIKLGRDVQPFRRWLGACAAGEVLDVELLVQSDSVPQRLNGAGMALLNPPWRLEQRLRPSLGLLASALAATPGAGRARARWLKGGPAASA